MNRIEHLVWLAVAVLGAFAFATVAPHAARPSAHCGSWSPRSAST